MKTKTLQMEPLNCPSCILKIKFGAKIDGVSKVKVSMKDSTVLVTYDEGKTDINKVKEKIESLGYTVLSVKN